MDLKIIIESNYKTNRRRKIEKGIIEFLAGNQGEGKNNAFKIRKYNKII